MNLDVDRAVFCCPHPAVASATAWRGETSRLSPSDRRARSLRPGVHPFSRLRASRPGLPLRPLALSIPPCAVQLSVHHPVGIARSPQLVALASTAAARRLATPAARPLAASLRQDARHGPQLQRRRQLPGRRRRRRGRVRYVAANAATTDRSGVVCSAIHVPTQQRVAIKKITPFDHSSESTRGRAR